MSHSSSGVYNKNLIAEPNFTQVPNVIFDHWMNVLDHCTSLVLLFLCRKTFGWHKKKDCLSLSKIEEGTNMSRNRVIKSLKTLEDYGLIKKQQHKNILGDQDPNTYELIIHGGVVHEENHVVHDVNHGGSAQKELGVVHGVNTQKKDLQKKDNIGVLSSASRAEKSKIKMIEFGKFVKLTEEDYKRFVVNMGSDATHQIIESINDYCTNHKTGGYKDYAAAFRTFAKRAAPKPSESGEYKSYNRGRSNNNKGGNKPTLKQGIYIDGKLVT